jgi:polysaccharide chain length determinant protein (PEP-CTERM system associated)
MLGGRQLTFDDYWAIVRRRRWLILVPIILGPVVALLIARKLPPKYTSTSLILIEEPKVPTSFVPSMLSNDLTARLAHMEEQILSRARLEPLIQQFGLYKEDWNSTPMDDLVDKVRESVVITPVAFSKKAAAPTTPGEEENQTPGYRVQFTADSPSLAQAMCTQITSMLIDADLRLGEQRAEGTATFLAGQLQGARQKLQEEDAKLAAFQRQYFGALPDQEQDTIQLLGSLTSRFDSLTDTLNRDQEEKTYLESVLSQQMSEWKASQTGKSPQTLQQQLTREEDELATMRLQYTDTYPDVVRLKEEIAALKDKIAHQPANKAGQGKKASSAEFEPPQIAQLEGQLHSLNTAIQIAEVDQARVRQELSGYEGKLKLTPSVEQQYKDITRDYQTALKFYDSLLAKEDESQMATSLQQQQGGENMEVLDPADLPHEPSFPDYWRFAGGGLLIGLVLGLGVALVLEMRDKALRDERDIEFFLELPTLTLVPSLNNGQKKLRGSAKRLGNKGQRVGIPAGQRQE